jgi:hypothetical protein
VFIVQTHSSSSPPRVQPAGGLSFTLWCVLLSGCTFATKGLEPSVGSGDGGPLVDTAVADRPPALDRAALDREPDAPPPAVGGTRCVPDSNGCATGFCVDGVCCDTACTGTCEACTASKTGGSDGVCAAIPAGKNPDGECKDQGATSCKSNGTCNGARACGLYPPGTACGAPACAAGKLTAPAVCDGMGTCAPSPAAACPGNFACADAVACKTACTGDADCTAPMGCEVMTGKCSVMKKELGITCAVAAECLSGFCADGVCCNLACGGKCRACLKELTGGTNGTCGDVQAGVKPTRANECPTQKATCGNNGLCDGNGACQQFADQTQCGTYCCNNGNNGPRICNLACGNGSCSVQTGTVAMSCNDNNDCTDDSCQNVGSNAECRHGNGCGPNQCCCQFRGNNNSMCAPEQRCNNFGGNCSP